MAVPGNGPHRELALCAGLDSNRGNHKRDACTLSSLQHIHRRVHFSDAGRGGITQHPVGGRSQLLNARPCPPGSLGRVDCATKVVALVSPCEEVSSVLGISDPVLRGHRCGGYLPSSPVRRRTFEIVGHIP